MSFPLGRRLPAKNLATCTLTLAIVLFTIGLPMGELCCVPSSPCCVGTPQAMVRQEMRAPIEDCCQSILSNERPALKVRLAARPDAPQPGVVPGIAEIPNDLRAKSSPPGPAAEPRPGPPPPPRTSRAPPLS